MAVAACHGVARAEPPDCTAPSVLPAGVLPQNAGGFRVVGGDGGGAPEVIVRRAGEAEPLPTRFVGPQLVRIDAELVAGEELAIELRDGCAARERPVLSRLRIGAERSRPVVLGTLSIGPEQAGEIPLPLSSGCMVDDFEPALGVYRIVELAPDPSSLAWLPLLPFVLRAPGAAGGDLVALEGGDPAAPPRFLVYARCDGGAGGLAEGEHEFVLETRAEGLEFALRTPATRAPLHCTEGALALVEEERAARARRALLLDVERATIRHGPLLFGGLLFVVFGFFWGRRRRKSRQPPER